MPSIPPLPIVHPHNSFATAVFTKVSTLNPPSGVLTTPAFSRVLHASSANSFSAPAICYTPQRLLYHLFGDRPAIRGIADRFHPGLDGISMREVREKGRTSTSISSSGYPNFSLMKGTFLVARDSSAGGCVSSEVRYLSDTVCRFAKQYASSQ